MDPRDLKPGPIPREHYRNCFRCKLSCIFPEETVTVEVKADLGGMRVLHIQLCRKCYTALGYWLGVGKAPL